MNATTWEIQLIKLYCIVCQAYDNRLAANAQRLSNNFRPQFTDEECITIYLWGLLQRKFEVKAVYDYTKMHLSDWFPRLPSYQAFNNRLCFLADTLREFSVMLVENLPYDAEVKTYLMDSMPIVVAKGVRSNQARVAKEFCNKGYCSSQQMYYYGIKLHVLGQKRYQTLPLPILSLITPASENDLTCAKGFLDAFHGLDIYADKAYRNTSWQKSLLQDNQTQIFTPVKLAIGQKVLDSADKLYSLAVSRTRQAIESFFAWIHEKTKIQSASKVRSLQGLLSFVFARISVVCLLLAGCF